MKVAIVTGDAILRQKVKGKGHEAKASSYTKWHSTLEQKHIETELHVGETVKCHNFQMKCHTNFNSKSV